MKPLIPRATPIAPRAEERQALEAPQALFRDSPRPCFAIQ
jgi:hypothetical protein